MPAVAFTPADDIEASAERMSDIVGADGSVRYAARRAHRTGTIIDVGVVASPIRDAAGRVVGIFAVVRDLTATKRADALRLSIEQRSHQAQRMASLGQLTGGVAHDFDNMLAVMMNYTAFAAARTLSDAVTQRDLAQVQLAIERAAGLTRQLLVFTREDRIQPRHVDVNAAIAGVQGMLERTIGEHIQLVAVPSTAPLTIFADPGQIQQVLVNLALNARDTMADGGTLVIEARRGELDGDQPDMRPAPAGGSYARLRVCSSATPGSG